MWCWSRFWSQIYTFLTLTPQVCRLRQELVVQSTQNIKHCQIISDRPCDVGHAMDCMSFCPYTIQSVVQSGLSPDRSHGRWIGAIDCIGLWPPLVPSAGVYPIFYFPSSIGTRGEGYRGHSTSRSVVGTAHPDPWEARHIPIRGTVRPRSESLKLNLGTRHWMQVKALESSSRGWNGTPLTLSGTFVNAHTQVYPHACVHRLQYHTSFGLVSIIFKHID